MIMDETQISSRQKQILTFLENGPLSRSRIQDLFASTQKVSKVTLFRDLRGLIQNNQIQSLGIGKATTYSKAGFNPVLTPPNTNFSPQGHVLFNFEIFTHLKNLLTPKENGHLQDIGKSLNTQIEKLNTTIARKELEKFVI